MTSDDIFELLKSDTKSSIDSNATASNLPGAGRTVGLLFDWLGARVESVLSRRALKLGYDPDGVAQDIRQICRHDKRPMDVRHKVPELQLTNGERKHLKKLCKKLVECARFVT